MFQLNVSIVLAHSVMHFAKEEHQGEWGAVKCLTPDTPQDRNYYNDTANALRAQVDLAPQLYAARANQDYGDPAYTRLKLQTLNSAVFGGNGQKGILDMYTQARPQLDALANQTRTAQRSADIADVQNLGGAARQAVRSANPDSAAILDRLNSQANSMLSAGNRMTPEQARAAQQASRTAFADRGMAFGPNAQLNEVLTQQAAGNAEQGRRAQMAAGVLQGNQAVYGDPFQQILGRPSQGVSNIFGAFGQGGGQQGVNGFLNPESQMMNDISNTNYNARAAAEIAGANNTAALAGAGISAL